LRQTTVQQASKIGFGSAKFEIGATVGTLVDYGAMNNISFKETWTEVRVMSENAGEIVTGIRDHKAMIEGEMLETYLTNLNAFRGGVDTLTPIAAAPVAVVNELQTLTGTTSVDLNFANGAGTEVTAITVTTAAGGATVRNTDYVITVDANGKTGIARIAGGLFGSGDVAKVSYTYTPNASATLTSGGKYTIAAKVVRLTNTDANGKKFRITVYSAKNQNGIEIKFPSDEALEPQSMKISMEGHLDYTRAAGDQLFEIFDER
jgi:hypothetical protein